MIRKKLTVLILAAGAWLVQGSFLRCQTLLNNTTGRSEQAGTYLVHSGDSLQIAYRLTPEFNQTVSVQPDGLIVLGDFGAVSIAGLSVQEAHDAIVVAASRHLNHPEIILSLKDFENAHVTVAGEVLRPGRVDLRQRTTALQAILMSGGFRDSAYDTHVYLFRRINESGDAEVRLLNLHDISRTPALERDLPLQAGDMLLVPRNKLERFSRVVHASALGLYFDPTTLK